jgi:type I restriction enzyme S subunit
MVEKTLGDVATYINGRAFKPQEWETSGRPIIRIQNLTNSTQECNRTTKQFEEKYRISDGDLLFAWSASLGAHIWHGEDGWLNQHIFKVIPNESIDKIYLYYYLLYVVDQLYAKTHGSGMVHITLKPFKSTRIMLPELNEQRRVVGKIESLFAKLDEAKEKAQAVVDSFETRKAAILHKAFTGELTAKWREEHGVSIDNWKTTRFDSVAAIRSNLVDPAEYQSFPHIAPDNIEKKTGVLLEYHTIAEDGVTSGKHRFYSGQILYSKIRPYLSKAVVVDFDGLCSADMYPIEAYQNARCLWYYMLSDEFLLQASTAGSRSVLPKINQKELSALTVHLPTNDREQEEIARILDELFDKEQQTKEAAEIVLDQIELMKKSILARAFRGELGTNDPNEESAVELLKRTIL